MNNREQKALEIAAKSKIGKKGGKWLVPSQSGNGAQYQVDALVPAPTSRLAVKAASICSPSST